MSRDLCGRPLCLGKPGGLRGLRMESDVPEAFTGLES